MSIPSSSRYKNEIILPSVQNNVAKPTTANPMTKSMKPANQRTRFFDHQLIGQNRMPQHLYNKKVVKLALDRFGPSKERFPDQKKGRNGPQTFRDNSNKIYNDSFDLSGQYASQSIQYLNTTLNIPKTTRGGPRAAVLNMSLGGPLRLTQNPFEEQDVAKRSQKKDTNKGITVLGRLRRQADMALDQSIIMPTDQSIIEPDNENLVFIEDVDQSSAGGIIKLRPHIRMQAADRRNSKYEKSTASLFNSTGNSVERMIAKTGRIIEKKPFGAMKDMKVPAIKMGLRLQTRHIRKQEIPVNTETSFHKDRDDLEDRNGDNSFNAERSSSDSSCKSLELYDQIGDDLKNLTKKSRGVIDTSKEIDQKKDLMRVGKKKSRRNNLVDLLEKGKRFSRVQTADKMKLSLKKARRKQEMEVTEKYRNQFAEKLAKDHRINRKQIEKMQQAEEDLVNEPQVIDLYIKNPKKYKLEMRDQIKDRYLKGLQKKSRENKDSDSDQSSSSSSPMEDGSGSVSVSNQSSIALDDLQDEKAFEAYFPPRKLDVKKQSSVSSVRKKEKSRGSSIEEDINQDNLRLIKLYRADDIHEKIKNEINFSNQDKIDQQVEHRKNKLKKRQFESSGGKFYKIKVNKAFQNALPPTLAQMDGPKSSHEQSKKIASLNRRFVTGPNGIQVVKAQIDDGFSPMKERSLSGNKKSDKSNESVIIEEMELSEFTEYEDQPISKEEQFYSRNSNLKPKTKTGGFGTNRSLHINKSPSKIQAQIIGKTKIEESNRIKNVKIWNDFEQKQSFYKLAKENRKIYENDGEAKFLENCLKMKVTPLPAFCRSDNNRVKKTLAPTILLGDADNDSRENSTMKGSTMKIQESSRSLIQSPTTSMRHQRRQGINVQHQTNRLGCEQQTLKLLNYYLSEKLAKATGEKLGDVEFLFKAPEQGIQRGSTMNFQGQDVLEQMVPNEFSNLKTKVLMLDDNGLLDKGLSYILDGLAKQKQLESLNISNNEIGPLSSAKLQQIFEGQNSKRHLVELRLSKIKFTNKYTFVEIVNSYLESPFMGLLALKLNEINLSEQLLLKSVLQMIASNKLIVDLNLQGSGLLPNQLEQVAHCVSQELKGIKYLNLAYNTIQYKPKNRHEESTNGFANHLCDVIKNSELVHLNLTGMNLSADHLKQIVTAISQSRHMLAAHLSNNENIEIEDRSFQYSLKLELFSILGINGYKWQMYNHLKRMRSIKAMQMTKDVEPQEESVINHFTYQEEVQKGRQVNQFMNFCEQKELVLSNFVIQRFRNTPELNFESALKNQIGAPDLLKSDKWQILELDTDRGDSQHATSQLPQNRCYLCEKSPNTLFFYSRAYRDEAFTRIADPQEKKKIIQTFFSTEATSNLFQMQNNDVLMTGSLVQWDTIKMKTVEKYGMQIDGTYYEQKAEERKEAKRLRKKYFKGFEPTTDEQEEGKKPMGPFNKLSDVNQAQINNMRNCKVIKYDKIVDDFDRNVPWQDQLKVHLKCQDDMCFINTPNFKRRGPIRSFVDVEQQLMSQIYIYGDFGLKPGKYSVICYDCADQTLWFKNVVVGLRQTHVIGQNNLSTEPRLEKCRLLFPKEQYFNDNSFNFHQLPSKLEAEIANTLRDQFEEEDPQNWHEEALQVFREYYGMFVFIFSSFGKISSYPCVNLQDFGYIMRSLKLNFSWSKLIEIFQEYQTDEIKIDRENIHNFHFRDQSQLFEVLIKVFWNRENDESPLKYFQEKVSSTILANVSEYIWDHLYNRHLWDSSQRQVMNLVFMNIDALKAVYTQLRDQARDKFDNDITEPFKKMLASHLYLKKRKDVGIIKESKKYVDITKAEFYELLKHSKLKIDQKLAQGIHNWNFDQYVPPTIIEEDDSETEQKQKFSGGNMIQVSFIEFLNFFIQMAIMLPTEAHFGLPGDRTPRIGERLNSHLDKVHRFLTFFIKEQAIQLPNVPGYTVDQVEDFQIKENPLRKVITRDSKQNLTISTLKTSMRQLLAIQRVQDHFGQSTPKMRNATSYRMGPGMPASQSSPRKDKDKDRDLDKSHFDPAVRALPSQVVFSESSEGGLTSDAFETSCQVSPQVTRKGSMDLLSDEEDDGAGTMDYNKIMTALVNHTHNYSPLNNYVYTDQTSDSSYD